MEPRTVPDLRDNKSILRIAKEFQFSKVERIEEFIMDFDVQGRIEKKMECVVRGGMCVPFYTQEGEISRLSRDVDLITRADRASVQSCMDEIADEDSRLEVELGEPEKPSPVDNLISYWIHYKSVFGNTEYTLTSPPPPGAPRAPGLPRSAGAARSRPERGSFGGRAPPPARPGCPDRRAPRDRGRVRGIFGARPPRYGAPSRCLTRADAARARPADPLGPVRRTPLPEPAPAPPRSRAGAPARMRGHRRRTSRARPTGRGRTFSSRSCGRSR